MNLTVTTDKDNKTKENSESSLHTDNKETTETQGK